METSLVHMLELFYLKTITCMTSCKLTVTQPQRQKLWLCLLRGSPRRCPMLTPLTSVVSGGAERDRTHL